MRNQIDITGLRYERLTVVSYAGKINGRTHWLCRCDCGGEKVAASKNIRNGSTNSCGCLQRERTTEANTTHGLNKTHAYKCWKSMHARCRRGKYWAGRGIAITPEWNNFSTFLKDMGHPPTNKHTLDRINNDLNYTKSNCRWITKQAQSRNKRSNRLVTYCGETLCVADWADRFGKKYHLIYDRLFVYGWSAERAFNES